MVKKKEKMTLKRDLNLFFVVVSGVGIILGAGIYALIGIAAGGTGNTIWLSFLVSAVVAAFTGLSYAELSSMFRGDAGEYDYCKHAFGKKFSIFVSLLIILTGAVSAATVALGFAGYFSSLVPIGYLASAIGIILLMTAINYWGISESKMFTLVATIIEFVGLIIIILLGFGHYGSVELFDMPNGFIGVLKAGALLFFAFMGFETIIKLREETKNPSKTIPKAIVISIFVTAVLYILVAIAAVSIIPYTKLAASQSPLSDVASVSLGKNAFWILGIIALFATSSTVLLTMLTSSRMMYGMSMKNSLPGFLCKVHKTRRTPYAAIFLFSVLTLAFAFIKDIEFVADLTTAFLFLTFAFINLGVIVLRYKDGDEDKERVFKMPLNIGRFPVLALLGVVTNLIMLGFSLSNIF